MLAAIGLYGVLSYSVLQRERELGTRIALGAAGGKYCRLVTMRVSAMVLLGAVAGLDLGWFGAVCERAVVWGEGADASMLVLPTAVLLAAALLAALPAVLRAVRIDPAIMLRAE